MKTIKVINENCKIVNYNEKISKLIEKRNIFPKGTGPYQKYNNAINSLKLLTN